MLFKSDVLKIINQHKGEENGIKAREICSILKIQQRYLRSIIEELRAEGELILSSNKGYFTPSSYEEVESTTQRVISHSKAQLKAFHGMRKIARTMFQ